VLDRLRRVRSNDAVRAPSTLAARVGFDADLEVPPSEQVPAGLGWDRPVRRAVGVDRTPTDGEALRTQILSIFADPRVDHLSASGVARSIERPLVDVETMLDAMVQAGELVAAGNTTRLYRVGPHDKLALESMFRDAATELGEHGVLARTTTDDALATLDDEAEEPRLPVTAGLLSLFLPGTGQLLNGDVGRASLVFAVWSLAWITHLSPVWTFVCLYAGAEAFFTAKIRSMERKLAKEAIGDGGGPPRALPPKPSQT
jgi:hypothetical protein